MKIGWTHGSSGSAVSGNTACYQQDKDYKDNDLQTMENAASAEDCQKKCQALQGCKFFTYVLDTVPGEGQACYAKTSDSGIYQRDDRVSGPQFCP